MLVLQTGAYAAAWQALCPGHRRQDEAFCHRGIAGGKRRQQPVSMSICSSEVDIIC